MKKVAIFGTILFTALFFYLHISEYSITDLSNVTKISLQDQYGHPDTPRLSEELLNDINPGTYVLEGTLLVPEEMDVKMHEVRILANTDARIIVRGSLEIDGGLLKTNERHPDKQRWHGITAEKSGNVQLVNTTIQNATTAATCAEGGHITISGSRFQNNVAAVITLRGGNCVIEKGIVQNGSVGAQTTEGFLSVTDTTFTNVTEAIRVFHESETHIENVSVQQVKRVVTWSSNKNGVIYNLVFLDHLPLEDPVIDGKHTPLYEWMGEQYARGIVTIE